MCNSLNHSPSCRCGFGGEGHLGRRTFGNEFPVLSNPNSFFTFHPKVKIRESGHYTSYIEPNAHCPVCGDEVYFYQSPHGGRVFFDQLGYPWTKHPCTDSNLWRTSRQHLKFIGDATNQLAIYFIHKWEDDGYFPMICEYSVANQIFARFLYENSQDSTYLLNSVRLSLKEPMMITSNSLFFIKDVDSSKGDYELKFCFRQSHNNHTKTQTIQAKIIGNRRPVLQNQRIMFRCFDSRIKVIKKCDIPVKSTIRTRCDIPVKSTIKTKVPGSLKKIKRSLKKVSNESNVKTKHPLDGIKIVRLVRKKTA